jgi:hypothetical protein
MKFVFVPLMLFLHFISFSQKMDKYFDYNWKECLPVHARFYARIEKTDSGWHRQDFFIRENRLQMDGFYADSSCTIKIGKFFHFHANGVPESFGNYANGKKNGLWLGYHPNKMMEDSIFFADGEPKGVYASWYDDGMPKDSMAWDNDGNITLVGWYQNGNVSVAGKYAAGKRKIGKWQYFHDNGQLSSLETFINDRLVDKKYFNEDGSAKLDTTNNDRKADFPGGIKAWSKYLEDRLTFPDNVKIINADQAVVIATFEIDENGQTINIKLISPFHPLFDKIVVDLIKKSPKWKPAIEHNRRTKYWALQKFNFVQE